MGEEAPLLLPNKEEEEEEVEEDHELSLSSNKWRQLVVELDKVFRLAGPMMFILLLGVAMSSSNEMFAGHLSSLELSAISLANSVIGNLAAGILSGLVSAQQTLCGQAFGAGQVGLLSVYLQRSWIVVILAAFILSPLYIFTTPILNLLGQDQKIARLAGRFAIRTIPQLFGTAISGPMQKFLLSQRKVTILAWIGLLTLLLHIGLSGIFVYVLGWGFDGLAVAYNISAWVAPIAQLIYIVGRCKDSWLGLSCSAFRDIWSYFRLSLANAISMCLVTLFTIVLILLAGHLKNAVTDIGAFSICMNVTEWVIMITAALNVAASVRVSNELGSGQVKAAKYAIYVISIAALAIGILSASAVLAFRDRVGALFTNDKVLQKTVSENANLLAVTLIAVSLQSPLAGAAVGVGLQVLCGYISFTAFYIIGIPVAFSCGFILQGGLQGVWAGMSSGVVISLVGSLIIVWKIDWKKEVARALNRVQSYAGLDSANA